MRNTTPPGSSRASVEGRITEIEGKLGNAQIIDVSQLNADGKVVFGATVDLVDVETGDEVTYQIVGEDEADIKAGRDLRQLAHCPRADRQGDRRCGHRQGARRRTRVRNRRNPLRVKVPVTDPRLQSP